MAKPLRIWFSGGGLADLGMKAAGLTPWDAVEFDDAIANVYSDNLGDHCRTADVRYVELTGDTPFWFHVSPPCTNASIAKTDGGETALDIELARAIVRGIEQRSPWFSLENVWGYRTFESFRLILESLSANGYNLAYWHLNSANYGVPQTRKRLILCASRVKRVIQPHPTHSKTPDLFAVPWIGWYEAITDLIPSLPDSQFAKWQLELLPEGLKAALHSDSNPSLQAKSWLVPGGNSSFVLRSQDEPSPTVICKSLPRALLVDGIANNRGTSVTTVPGDRPPFTIKASAYMLAVRAYIPNGRVVYLTPECLARFQSVPDGYRLTGKPALDCRVISNGFPCLLAKALVDAQGIS